MMQLRALNLIDSRWQGALDGRFGDSVNPASGQEIGSFAASGKAEARLAIAAARSAFERASWSQDAALRVRLLLGWAERLERRSDLAYLLTLENGKVLAQSRRELAVAIAGLRRHAEHLRLLAVGGAAPLAGVGVAALIVPWQAPLAGLVGSLAPALAAGCTAVVTPAPQSAQIVAAVIGELHALEALPAGVVNLVCASGHEVAHELTSSTDVEVLCFSGSQESGRKTARAAGTKKLLFDLAGKSCCVVFADVDMDAVARKLAAAATVAAGQHCSAPRRILVHASGFEQACAALKLALAQVRVGPGGQPGCDMGPLIDAPALVAAGVRTEQVLSRCDDVILRGSRGSGPLSDGYFLSPTLVVQHDCAADSAHDEIFGPFVAIGQFEDDSEALACVNAMHQAHSVSLWSGAVARVQPLLQALHHGRVGLNRHNWLAPRTRGAMQLDRRQPCALFDFVALPGEAVNQREVHAYH